MITRGHLIGQIIDELSAIGEQAKLRSSLNLNDVSVFCENFFRDVINITEGWKLVNLNEERLNAPGLDLSDINAKVAVQITNTRTSEKINHTLSKITTEQADAHTRFVIFMISGRQKTYKGVDKALLTQHGFKLARDVWDPLTIAKRALSLPIKQVQALHELVRMETARVKVELEIPNANGVYPTSGYDRWEQVLKPRVGDGQFFTEWHVQNENTPSDPDQLQESLELFAGKLASLPRITREFLAVLYERSELERKPGRYRSGPVLVLAKVERMYQGGDLVGELEILRDAKLVDLAYPDSDETPPIAPAEIALLMPGKCRELRDDICQYVQDKGLSFRTIIGGADLSAF